MSKNHATKPFYEQENKSYSFAYKFSLSIVNTSNRQVSKKSFQKQHLIFNHLEK